MVTPLEATPAEGFIPLSTDTKTMYSEYFKFENLLSSNEFVKHSTTILFKKSRRSY